MQLPEFATRKEQRAFFRSLDGSEKINALNAVIAASRHIVFFGGAGVSTASGIPDFRSRTGIYTKYDESDKKRSSNYLMSADCIRNDPELFYANYRKHFSPRHVQPNAAHHKLAEMEAAGKLDGIITQNADGLHHKAGSKNILELHGSAWHTYCMDCKRKYSRYFIIQSSQAIPTCPFCGGKVRPGVVYFGEPIDQAVWAAAKALMARADCLIIGGTSLKVRPASSLIYRFAGNYIILINNEPTAFDEEADLLFHENIAEVMAKIRI